MYSTYPSKNYISVNHNLKIGVNIVEKGFDPIELSKLVKRIVVKGYGKNQRRKYFRFRGGRWYGGIATGDCVGCNLRCVFCWGWYARDNADKLGRFYTAEQVYYKLIRIIRKHGYNKVRVSGGEPTLSRDHLIQLLELFSDEGILFILETNGILIGYDETYARDLAKYDNVHVRVSIKGATPEEFSMLTLAKPKAFELQLKALQNLIKYNVSCHPAIMVSFSSKEGLEYLARRLVEIDRRLITEIEEEYVLLYPHVVKKLREYGIKPKIAFKPDGTIIKCR